jgi:hypothetical protein
VSLLIQGGGGWHWPPAPPLLHKLQLQHYQRLDVDHLQVQCPLCRSHVVPWAQHRCDLQNGLLGGATPAALGVTSRVYSCPLLLWLLLRLGVCPLLMRAQGAGARHRQRCVGGHEGWCED